MGVVKDKLLDPAQRKAVLADCVTLIDKEVDSKGGVTGMMIKGGYKAFTKLRPGIVSDAMGFLLDDFATILDQTYADYLKAEPNKATPFDRWTAQRENQIANAMLGITDRIIDSSDKTVIKKIYHGMRKAAEKNVEQAVPAVSRLVLKYVG